jgi:hypothetical protein
VRVEIRVFGPFVHVCCGVVLSCFCIIDSQRVSIAVRQHGNTKRAFYLGRAHDGQWTLFGGYSDFVQSLLCMCGRNVTTFGLSSSVRKYQIQIGLCKLYIKNAFTTLSRLMSREAMFATPILYSPLLACVGEM